MPVDDISEMALILERLNGRLDRSEEIQSALLARIEHFEDILHSSKSEQPGMVTRVDRIEQAMLRNQKVLNYIFGGGVLTTIATLAILIKMLAVHA
jgi:hypothetical protein